MESWLEAHPTWPPVQKEKGRLFLDTCNKQQNSKGGQKSVEFGPSVIKYMSTSNQKRADGAAGRKALCSMSIFACVAYYQVGKNERTTHIKIWTRKGEGEPVSVSGDERDPGKGPGGSPAVCR